MSHEGRFVWYDLMTGDPQRAVDFYTGLVGWGTEQWQGGQTPYTMWTREGKPLGGVMELPEEARAAGAPPHWLGYVGVADVDATVEKVTAAGGKVWVAPTDIPSVGRFAVFGDPQGAVVAAFTPAGDMPAHEGPPRVQDFSWHELMTRDHAAAFDFYAGLFGWERGEAMDMGPAGIYQLYRTGDLPLGGMFNAPPEMGGMSAWLYYVRVPDAREAAGRVEPLGGKVLHGPMEVPGGDHIVQCADPTGAMFALHSSVRAEG